MPAILLTRPDPVSSEFTQMLHAVLGEVEVVQSPLLRLQWRSANVTGGMPVFTSRNGVEGFLRAGGVARGTCWCVGDATARAAEAAGFEAKSAKGDAQTLIRAIVESGEAGPYLHVRGAHARGDVALTLRQAGLAVTEAIVYEQQVQDLNNEALALLGSEKPVVVPLFSPRTAAQFARAHHGDAPLFIVAMSGAVLAALDTLRFDGVAVADTADARTMAELTARLFDAALRLEGVSGAK